MASTQFSAEMFIGDNKNKEHGLLPGASTPLDSTEEESFKVITEMMKKISLLEENLEKAEGRVTHAQKVVSVLGTELGAKKKRIRELEAAEPEVVIQEVVREIIREVPVVVTKTVTVNTPVKTEVLEPEVKDLSKEKAEVVKTANKVEGLTYHTMHGIAQVFMMLGALLGMTVSAPLWIITGLGLAMINEANKIRNREIMRSLKEANAVQLSIN